MGNKRAKWSFVAVLFTLMFALILLGFINQDQADNGGESAHFYFIQITDSHIGEDPINLVRLEKIIEKINSLDQEIEFIVHTGDIFHENIKDEKVLQEVLNILNKSNYPIYYTAGNHDILLEDFDETKDFFIHNFNNINFYFENSGVICMFAYTYQQEKQEIDPLKDIEINLRETNGKSVILFHHIPHQDWSEDAEKEWVEMVNNYNVQAVIAGHYHNDMVDLLDEVPLYIADSVSLRGGRKMSFRIYEYNNGQLEYTKISLNDLWWD